MDSNPDAFVPTRRQQPRTLLRQRAQVRIGSEVWAGTVHDVSSGGLFFQPSESLTSGEHIHAEDAWMVAPLGASVVVVIDGERGIHEGRVTWTGCSDLHRCSGLGVRLDAPHALAA